MHRRLVEYEPKEGIYDAYDCSDSAEEISLPCCHSICVLDKKNSGMLEIVLRDSSSTYTKNRIIKTKTNTGLATTNRRQAGKVANPSVKLELAQGSKHLEFSPLRQLSEGSRILSAVPTPTPCRVRAPTLHKPIYRARMTKRMMPTTHVAGNERFQTLAATNVMLAVMTRKKHRVKT